MPFAFRTVLRHVRRRPADAALNVLGLAVGLACFGLVGLYVGSETAVDAFHPNGDRVVRLSTRSGPAGEVPETSPTGPQPLALAVAAEVPGVEAAVRVLAVPVHVRRQGQVQTVEARWVDPAFFDLFGFRVVAGDARTALARPGSVVLTETTARRLTGSNRPLGQTVQTEEGPVLTVTAVVADPPRTHLPFEALGSIATVTDGQPGEWFTFDVATYVLLERGTNREAFDAAVRGLAFSKNREAFEAAGYTVETVPEALPEIYLGGVADRQGATGDARRLGVLAAIGLFVLAVAAVNFVNLATARSGERAREVGVRKALGSARGALVGQFLGEAIALAALAGVVALGLVAAGLPAFNGLAGSSLTLGALVRPVPLALALAVVVTVGLLAGVYPALVLSRARPADAMRGRSVGLGGDRLRQGLVVFQFAVSSALLVAMFVAADQLRHMREQPLGFEAGPVVLVDIPTAAPELFDGGVDRLKEAFARAPGVAAVTATGAPPGFEGWSGQVVQRPGAPERASQKMEVVVADADYARVFGLRLAAGRDLSDRVASDVQTAVLLNETAARSLGWTPAEALGQTIETNQRSPGEVVGVVRDYRHHGVRDAVGAQVYFATGGATTLAVRLAGGEPSAALAGLRRAWDERLPGHAFEARPFEAAFDAQYASEEQLAQAFAVFGGLAVLVACLGLFGLAAHAAQSRTKEIGVRKVLGATVTGVAVRLAGDFATPVVVGLAVAAPLTWWVLGHWLDGYAERVALTPLPFVLAGLGALAVALLTVSLHTVRAAAADPVRALRSE